MFLMKSLVWSKSQGDGKHGWRVPREGVMGRGLEEEGGEKILKEKDTTPLKECYTSVRGKKEEKHRQSPKL